MSTDIECTGYNSCRSSTITTSNGNLDCMGEYTCASSDITVVQKNANNDAIVSIYGRLGAYYSTISADVVKAYGNHAIYAATIDSEGRSDLLVEAYSPMAASYSRIICRSGSECMLKCKGTGCFYANYICLPGAKCQVRPKKCKPNAGGSYKGVDCPMITNTLTEDTLDAHLKELEGRMINDEEFKKLEFIVNDFDHLYIENEVIDVEFDEDDVNTVLVHQMTVEEEAHDTYYIEAVGIIGLILLLCGITLCYRKNKKKSDGYQTLLTDGTIQV